MATRYVGVATEGLAAAYVIVAGMVAVSARPRRSAWHLALAGWAIVASSLVTVLALAALVNWARYPPVPSVTLLKIALAQSAFGWLLLLTLAGLRTR
jgi:hypothetical protein